MFVAIFSARKNGLLFTTKYEWNELITHMLSLCLYWRLAVEQRSYMSIDEKKSCFFLLRNDLSISLTRWFYQSCWYTRAELLSLKSVDNRWLTPYVLGRQTRNESLPGSPTSGTSYPSTRWQRAVATGAPQGGLIRDHDPLAGSPGPQNSRHRHSLYGPMTPWSPAQTGSIERKTRIHTAYNLSWEIWLGLHVVYSWTSLRI